MTASENNPAVRRWRGGDVLRGQVNDALEEADAAIGYLMGNLSALGIIDRVRPRNGCGRGCEHANTGDGKGGKRRRKMATSC